MTRPMDTFNELSPIPQQMIDLKDGRILSITKWTVSSDEEFVELGRVPVTVEGFILKPPYPPDPGRVPQTPTSDSEDPAQEAGPMYEQHLPKPNPEALYCSNCGRMLEDQLYQSAIGRLYCSRCYSIR